MPTVSVVRDKLFNALNQEYTDEAFDELCFEFGIELDDVVEEDDEVVYKIDIPANRYDLLCVQGISQALNAFRGICEPPNFQKLPGSEKIIVKKSAEAIRPYVVGAVLRDMEFNENTFNDFIDLQDKLHMNICRRRKWASIGTHDLDSIKGPFTYEALPPEDIEFRALKQSKSMDAKTLLQSYESDTFMKQFIGLIQSSPVYPIIKDSNNVVCSLPPIINGEHSKVTLSTKNVFIEITALDLTKARIVLDTMVTMFSMYCSKKFTCETVSVEYEVSPTTRNATFPDLDYRSTTISSDYINKKIGVSQEPSMIASSLQKMGLAAILDPDNDTIHAKIPPTRHDILHACDVMEDAAIAYGFNNIKKQMPRTLTIGKAFQLNKLTDLLRNSMAQMGYTEGMTFSLCSRDDVSKKVRKPLGKDVVHIGNPKTLEFQICRTSLLPGLLKTVAANRSLPLPLKLFEVSDCVVKSDNDVGAKNTRKLAAVWYNTTSGFENIMGLADMLMELLEMKNYRFQPTDDPMYFPGRCCDLVVKYGGGDHSVGRMGVAHPEVLGNFELTCPCSCLEIDVEFFETKFE